MKEPLQPSRLYKGPIRHLVLSDEFIHRVRRFKGTLADVDGTSLEETMDKYASRGRARYLGAHREHLSIISFAQPNGRSRNQEGDFCRSSRGLDGLGRLEQHKKVEQRPNQPSRP